METNNRKVVSAFQVVRAEYISARVVHAQLHQRLIEGTRPDGNGHLPAEVNYKTQNGQQRSIQVRSHDVRFLDRVNENEALEQLSYIHLAREGSRIARLELRRRESELLSQLADRFADGPHEEGRFIVPCTSHKPYTKELVSNKGAVLLDLMRQGFATADFCILTSETIHLDLEQRQKWVRLAIRQLEALSGRRLGDPQNPLLIAMRSAMPKYIPGFMPTYLNVGYTPQVAHGLPDRYRDPGAARILLNSRKTLLGAIDPVACGKFEDRLSTRLTPEQNRALAQEMESLIAAYDPLLLRDPYHQVDFFLSSIFDYYQANFKILRGLMNHETHYPAVIFQRMVCSVIDDHSYAGVIFSRNPSTGRGVMLQFARAAFGEDLMIGRLPPEEVELMNRDQARDRFPAVYHVWPRLEQLERMFEAPIMLEFTAVHGTFTILQVDPAVLSGPGMLAAVNDMHQAGHISAERVEKLIQPYHLRQIKSNALDPCSFRNLKPFCRAFAILPRSAVSGRIVFSSQQVNNASQKWAGDKIVLAKPRFHPIDAANLKGVDGICSLSPAGIHVKTTALARGIPALLNLEAHGVRIENECMINADGAKLREGDWVTISSRRTTLFAGKAARVRKTPLLSPKGHNLRVLRDFESYRRIMQDVPLTNFNSLRNLGQALLYGGLQDNPKKAGYVNRCVDANLHKLVDSILNSDLGLHRINFEAWKYVTIGNRVKMLKSALGICRERGLSGYEAGGFLIGYLVNASSSVLFWEAFAPDEVAFLINEWLLHQKYLDIQFEMGERQINRTKKLLMTRGLRTLSVSRARVASIMALKLAEVDLANVHRLISVDCDPQTIEVVELLMLPISKLFHLDHPWERQLLDDLYEIEQREVPEE